MAEFEPEIRIPGVVYPSAERNRRYVEAGVLTHETLAQGFCASAADNAERPAVVWLGGSLTFAELDAASDRFGAGLLKLGLRPLDRVVFQMTNSPEQIIAYLGCWKAGLIPLCTLAAHREQEIGYLAHFASASAHIVEVDDPKFDFLTFARAMRERTPSLELIIAARGAAPADAVGFDGLAFGGDLYEARRTLAGVIQDPWQVAAFQLSGGTTGVPKIIPRLNSEYLYNMRAVMAFKGWTKNDRTFVPMPFAHNLNMGCCWTPFLMTGGSVVAAPRMNPEIMAGVLRELRPTMMAAAKPTIMRLKAGMNAGSIDLSSVREIFSTDGAEQITREMGVAGHHVFGMTEGVIMFTRDADSKQAIFNTVGRPVSEHDEVRLLKPGTEIDAEPGEIGELAIRGPYTILGYFNAEERNRETFTSDGFYRSGDLLRRHSFDGRDYYSFEGRIKDVVDRAGEKVNCEEVERAVMHHPAFLDVAVVGMPDPTHGERICLFAIPRQDQTLPSVAELGAFLKDYGLAIFKWPERIEQVEALPLTKVGKLDKPALKRLIADILAAEAAEHPRRRAAG